LPVSRGSSRSLSGCAVTWSASRKALRAVLHILLRVIAAHLDKSSGASSHIRFGAVSFIHRCGMGLS
jgi:hypothetical protein